jgi:hypothetical protein
MNNSDAPPLRQGIHSFEPFSIADDPEDFAEALIELYRSEELWNRLSVNGIKETKARYSIDAARKELTDLFNDVHINTSRGRNLKVIVSRTELMSDVSTESWP